MPDSRVQFAVMGGFGLVAVTLVAQFAVADNFRTTEKFKNVKNVREAVTLAQQRLREVGKPEYAALLTEDRVRAAIRTAVKSYEITVLEKAEQRFPGTKEHFEADVKPVCLQIADKGDWPAGCSIDAYFSLNDKRNGEEITYDGLGLGLQIETPDAKFRGFTLPIVSLFYGKIEPYSD